MIVLNLILYYLVIIPISLLPFPVLYKISDFLYVVLYKILGYRKDVVLKNLYGSFPEKSDAEINEIAALFYSHFCDVVVESLKSFTISNDEILKRMIVANPELANRFYDEGRSVIVAGGHYNNWEWIATSIDQQIKHQSLALYKQLANKFLDKKLRETRGRFGLILTPTINVKEIFEKFKHELTLTIFGSDQSPGKVGNSHWMQFLNRDTAVLFGTEKYAKAYNFPVLFGKITKLKRGFYKIDLSVVESDPISSPHGYITERCMQILEADIIELPQYWLWTHRRWKHKREQGTVKKDDNG